MSFVNTSTTLPYIRSGQLRAIAVAETTRLTAAPEIPTLDEAGLPGFAASPWIGLGARAGTPREIIERLNESARRGLARPAALARLAAIGVETRSLTSEQFAAFIRAENEKWREIIRRSGAKADP